MAKRRSAALHDIRAIHRKGIERTTHITVISVQLCGDMEAAEVGVSHVDGHDAENDRVDCPTCGTAIIPAAGIEDDIDEVEGDAPVPRKRKAVRQPTAPRGFKRFNPGVTQIKEIRRAIRVEMIASMVCHLL